MDSTLDKRIAAMRGSLMDTALEAAESRGQGLAGVAHVLYALYRDDGDTFRTGLRESMLGRWRGVCHWRSELPADPVRVFVHWLECETAYAPYGGEANRLYRHMADILERTFPK